MNLAVRDIRANKARFALTTAGLGLLLGVVMSMGGIYRGLFADALSISRAIGADIWVVQQDSNGPFAGTSRIPEDVKYRIAAVPGVAAASPLSFQTIQIDRTGKLFRFFLVGYDLAGLGGPSEIVAGRGIRQKHYEMVVSKGMRMALGEKIRLGQDEYTVVGVTGRLVSSAGDPAAFVSLADAQKIQFQKDNDAVRNDRARIKAGLSNSQTLSPAQVQAIAPTVAGFAGNQRIVNAVAARLAPGADAEEVRERIERWNHYQALSDEAQTRILCLGLIEQARQQLGLFRIILLVISTVIVSLIIYTSTLDKLRVIATLKLIGAPNAVIAGMILTQSLIMGVLAYGVGYVLINLTYEKFPRRVVLEAADLRLLFVIILVICTVASLAGIRKAMRVEPGEALGG